MGYIPDWGQMSESILYALSKIQIVGADLCVCPKQGDTRARPYTSTHIIRKRCILDFYLLLFRRDSVAR